jgi:solute carrier family 13 (sodium-dependent dicarboxylate transporter), member 2/3/5
MNTAEKIVACIFIGTAIAWITRGLIWKDLLPMVDDATIALINAMLFFMIPSFSRRGSLPNASNIGNKKKKIKRYD